MNYFYMIILLITHYVVIKLNIAFNKVGLVDIVSIFVVVEFFRSLHACLHQQARFKYLTQGKKNGGCHKCQCDTIY